MSNRESERSRAKRAQIRTGATKVFLAEGFSGATTDAIAKSAGVSKQTLYAYYGDKEELMVEVLTHLLTELNRDQPIPEAARPVDSREELRQALLELASGLLAAVGGDEYLALTRLIIAEAPRVPGIGQLWARTITGTIRSVVAAQLTEAQRTGVIVVEDIEVATRLFTGGVLTYVLPDAVVVTESPVEPPAPDRVERMVDTFLRAIT